MLGKLFKFSIKSIVCLILGALVISSLSFSKYFISKSLNKLDSDIHYFSFDKPYRGWQGITTDGSYYYVTSDRDENFNFDDIIEKYSLNGKLLETVTDAYTTKDPKGNFMSFGSPTIINNQLYVTAYDCNSARSCKDCISHIAVYSLSDLKLLHDYPIGSNNAECIQLHNGYYWVCYYDTMTIKKFDLDFNPVATYPLSQRMKAYGGYQAIVWIDNYIYLNWHGANKLSQQYVGGLDKYYFNGKSFEYLKEYKTPTFGCGQSVSKWNNYWIWNDRPTNRAIISDFSY